VRRLRLRSCSQLCVIVCMVAAGSQAALPEEPTPTQVVARQAPARTTVVTRTEEPVSIDGVLDEPIWRAAPKLGDLIQRQPRPGQPPTEKTDVTLLYDERALYIGVVAYDSDPAGRRWRGTRA
jgi:hypothetical protein